ncbi:Predicted arabinose efflux permease, MFS family [Saccharopolyspora antimicrobica]|uniref:MFS family arabinose efflux permease n=1 Tax=Saccharopolyspora antimicrobica TaxID=455193 RepID=A0A1I5CA22_9PSEU|nr:putative MFS family arabinose efflux permease [Saccharopolyspora antimicrobica]SFN83870.1 Predicted arabinose efflux permease, MFS family [Saccharopolyspora antimicrobica]
MIAIYTDLVSHTTIDEADTDQDFRRYLAARATSVTGSLVATVALPVLVYQLTGSPGWTSAIAVAEALPYLLFGLIAGAVADRADRRALMLIADFGGAALLATIPAAWAFGMLTAPHVLVVGFCVQTLFVIFDSANFGALPTLVGKQRLTAAYSKVYAATTLAELAIPPLTGLLVAIVSPAPLIAVNVITALASGLLVRSIVRPLSTPKDAAERRTTTSILADIRAGLAFLAHHRVVRTLTLVGTTHSVASGAYVAMLVPWADRVLGVPPSGDWRIAVLFSGWGVGGLLASRIVPRLNQRYGGARLALGALPVSLLCGCAVLLSTNWIAAALSATAWGAAYSTVVINSITYRQQISPDELQSRINTTCRMLSWGIGMPTGAALAGAVAMSGAGPRTGIATGVLVLLIGVIAAWCSPLRKEPRP